MIPSSSLSQIRARADLAAIAGEHTKLRRVGRDLVGLCPFHAERTPSFTVSPEKQLWHCFGGCGGGDVISLVQRAGGLTFADAVKELAERTGVPIGEAQPHTGAEYRLAMQTAREAALFWALIDRRLSRLARDLYGMARRAQTWGECNHARPDFDALPGADLMWVALQLPEFAYRLEAEREQIRAASPDALVSGYLDYAREHRGITQQLRRRLGWEEDFEGMFLRLAETPWTPTEPRH